MLNGGMKFTAIQAQLKCSRGALRSTFDMASQRLNGESMPRFGRALYYIEADERRLLRHVRLNPKESYLQVIKSLDLVFGRTTIKKILTQHGIANWRARRRPFLTEAHAAKRLAWCLKNRYRNVEEWGMHMWSDECLVERGRGKQTEWVFRTPAQKWDKEMVQTYDCHKNMKVMVWGAFWDRGRTGLYIMDRDFESKKHGYSANSYLEVLDHSVAPAYATLEPSYLFMQDNASIHKAHKVRDWFRAHNIL
jgi:hypothetical protein